ncbi:non-ribosomal peptide synthetase [Xanthomonas sp. 1678]|uniref:non-ribosomal peptide synthetase n=1 Tax=Xanthomonas sp. 1678 TaxID=3158788 RepID=UPI002865B26F|nr:amino acid adenylation domain-containing protein [Xanthomonas translucens]
MLKNTQAMFSRHARLQPVGDRGIPVTAQQAGVWLHCQIASEQGLYNLVYVRDFGCHIDDVAGRRAVQDIVARHSALRVRFNVVDGKVVQLPVADPEVPWSFREGTADGEAGTQAGLDACIDECLVHVFDLAHGPLLRMIHLRSGDRSVLVFTVHHICFDALSLGIFEREFDALLGFHSSGGFPPLPEAPASYLDFCRAQHLQHGTQAYAGQLEYWQRKLSGLSASHGLPLRQARPEERSYRGQTFICTMEQAHSAQLRTLSAQLNVTLFTLLHALFAIVLARHANNSDVVIGVPFAKRIAADGSGVGLDNVIGLFADPVVLRLECRAGLSFRQLVAEAQRTSIEALANSDVPFSHLAKAQQQGRSGAAPPLFQIMLNMVDEDEAAETGFQLVATPLAKYDLNLHASGLRDGRIEFHFNYSADLFTSEWIERLHRHLVQLAISAVSDPDAEIHALTMLEAPERERLLAYSRAGGDSTEPFRPLVDRFEAHAVRQPQAIAMVDAHGEISFGDLAVRVAALAGAIRGAVAAAAAAGLEPIVAVHVTRGMRTLLAMLASLRAGAAFLCLDDRAPAAHNRRLLEAVMPAVLVADDVGRVRSTFGARFAIVDVDGPWDAVDPAAVGTSGPQDLMYVAMTSGSTGQPKGVMVEHRQFAGFMAGFAQQCATLGAALPSTWLVSHAFTFDPSLIGLGLLCEGSKVVVLSREQMTDPPAVAELVRAHAAPVFKTSPAFAAALVPHLLDTHHAPHLIVGGDDTSASTLALLQRYRARTGRRVVNAYGPTETTVNCTYAELDDVVTIGGPMQGCRVHVLGEGRELLPLGSIGELHVGGDCVARGYFGRADLTATAFVEDPFQARGRLYRTGDLVRWRDDGRLQFVGRRDAQVKVRGFRVEPGEVEHAILATGAVVDARVVLNPQTQQLVAFLIAHSGDATIADTLERVRQAVAGQLPEYMQPSRYASVAAWPLTGNGKLDRVALLANGTFIDAQEGGELTDAVEEQLAQIWSSLLGVEEGSVRSHSCFFMLGGHSLIAIQLSGRIHERFGCVLPVRDVFEHSRLAAMASRIRAAMKRGDLSAIPVLADGAVRVPASYSQNKFWLVDNVTGQGDRFNLLVSIALPAGSADADVRAALELIVQRHAALRTTFEYQDGLWQVVHGQCDIAMLTSDLRDVADPQRGGVLARLIQAEAGRFRDLGRGPLLDAQLIKLAERDWVLLNVHHIATDAWSNEVLSTELRQAYAAIAAGRTPQLPPLPVQYRDYAAWQRTRVGERLPVLEAYWRGRLDGAPATHSLPLDHVRPSIPSGQGAVHVHRIEASVQQRFSALLLEHRATLFVGFQAVFSAFLARWGGERDVVIGTATANRDHPDTRYMVGAFVDTVVLRNEVATASSFVEHLRNVRDDHLRDQSHFDMPFEELVRSLNPVRGSHSPFFQVVLNLVYSGHDGLAQLANDATSSEPGPPASVNYDLTLYARPTPEGVELEWWYATDLFTPATIARMADSFQTLLQAAVADPAAPVQALPMVGEAELAELADLAEGAPLQRPAPLLPHWLRSNAQQRGAQPAVLLEDQALDHAGLDARSNQFARALVAAGVRPGDRVGVCQQRTLDMVASVLGTLKAGAVYVPLDPGYPDARLAFLLADAGIGHVLAEEWLAAQLPLSGQTVVAVEAADAQSAAAFDSPVTRESAAYMIHTSGSTGQPKGVLVEHGALADKLAALAQQYGLGEDERGLLFASMSFDASLSQLLAPLCVGGSVVLRPDGMSEPEAVLAHVRAQRVTWLHVVPAYLRQLLEVGDWSGTALRRVSCGGDVLDRGLQQAWFGAGRAGIALYNSYGPTEITITASVHEVSAAQAVVPIGRPLPGVRYWVLDGQGRVLPRGAVGELCIGGRSLARGYWNRPELSGERFVTLEPLPGRGERMYRSGDRVRWNAAGELEFVGRSDHQVKVRGHRIELGEVEAALQACPGVAAAVVKVEQDSLWAYVELAGSTAGQVEAALAERLPAHLLPSGYEVVGEWPLTRSGKRDRAALVRGQGAAALRRGPSNAVEQALLEIWTALLKREDIAVTDNFFQKGGHSLLATRLASQIRRRFEVAFTLKSLFELPSIEEQAAFIEVLVNRVEGKGAVEEFSL